MAGDCLQALAYSAVAAAALVALGRGRTPLDEETDPKSAARSSAWSLGALAVMLAAAVATGAALTGYGAFGYLVAREVFWIAVLAATGFLLLRLVDDLCEALFRPEGWAGRALFVVFGVRRSTVDQLAVLTSGVLRLLLALGVLSLALAPFGQGGGALLGGFRRRRARLQDRPGRWSRPRRWRERCWRWRWGWRLCAASSAGSTRATCPSPAGTRGCATRSPPPWAMAAPSRRCCGRWPRRGWGWSASP